jgi:hypothetical protein
MGARINAEGIKNTSIHYDMKKMDELYISIFLTKYLHIIFRIHGFVTMLCVHMIK